MSKKDSKIKVPIAPKVPKVPKAPEPKLIEEEAKLLINFLDDVTIKGHQKRNEMNVVVNKLIQIINYKSDK